MKKEDFVKEIKEIVELVKMCPQNLQEKCFEILLSHVLSQKEDRYATPAAKGVAVDQPTDNTQETPPEVKKRINAFSGQHQLSEAEVYKVFSVDETGNVNIEVTDLKSKKIAQQQRRLALLIGVKHQFTDGSFSVPKDELREACVTYSAYDAANFVQNLKNMNRSGWHGRTGRAGSDIQMKKRLFGPNRSINFIYYPLFVGIILSEPYLISSAMTCPSIWMGSRRS